MTDQAASSVRNAADSTGKYLREQKEIVDAHLDEFLPSGSAYPEVVHEACRYSLFAGGKRLRPILALATGEALGGDFSRLIYFACALEMIHTYSLIHDDLPAMDDDDYRRGRLSAHKAFGEGVAILAGNALLTGAFQLLSEIPGGSEWADVKVALIHRIAQALGTYRGLIGGQVVDLISQGKPFSRHQLDYIHSSKTGALIQVSVVGAACLSQASEEERCHLEIYGCNVGLAFQIVDDILDEVGSGPEMGKASRKDSVNQKVTYPAMYGVDRSRRISVQLVNKAVQEITFLGSRGDFLKELAEFISVRRF